MLWPKHLAGTVAACCVLCFAAPAVATVRYVETTGDDTANNCTSPGVDACQTIAQALNQAGAGDEVIVGAGTYDISSQLSPSVAVYLHGALGGPRPVVRGPGSPLWITQAGTTVRHLAFQVTGSTFGTVGAIESDAGNVLLDDIDVSLDNSGSAVNIPAVAAFLQSPATGTLTLSNSTVSAITEVSLPVVWAGVGQLVVRNTSIERRSQFATAYPALGATSGGPPPAPTLDAQNVTVQTDRAGCVGLTGTAGAGSVLKDIAATQDAPGLATAFDPCVVVDRTGTLENVTVNAPESSLSGACCSSVPAVVVGWNSVSSAGNVVLKNLNVTTNAIGLYAGAVSGLQVRGGRFTGRYAGIEVTGALGVISDAFTWGAGTDGYGIAADGGSSIRMRNLTAIGTGTRHGIFAQHNGTAITVKNSIARGTGIGADIGTDNSGAITVSYSNYVDTESSSGTITDTGGHQTGDPLFSNPVLFDYHVLAGSPVVDAGTTDVDLGATDIDGEARNQGKAPDIGADERPAPPQQPPPDGGGGGGGDGGGGSTQTPPTDTTPTTTTTQTGSQNVPGPVVTISAAAVKVTKTGVANIRIGCPATAAGSCTGTLGLQTATAVAPAAKKKIVKLGSRSFKLGAGKQAFVGVKLNKQARKLLKKLKRLRVKAIANVRDGNGASRITQRLLSLKLR